MMNYFSLEKDRGKSSIAWFKLSEVIMRGEKERVLTIYRLLIHSLPEKCLKIQLEADILRIFGDRNGAIDCYIKAAHIYRENNNWAQAISLYKIITDLAPEAYNYSITLLELEDKLQNEIGCKIPLYNHYSMQQDTRSY